MEQKDYIEIGLNGEAPLKVIMRGSIEKAGDDHVGVVALVYATMSKEAAEKKIAKLMAEDNGAYYMVYSVPMELDLTTLEHYPCLAITKDDLNKE